MLRFFISFIIIIFTSTIVAYANDDPYHYSKNDAETAFSRGFFMDLIPTLQYGSVLEKSFSQFDQRRLRRVFVQPGLRLSISRSEYVDKRYSHLKPSKRPHIIATENGILGIVDGFPDAVLSQKILHEISRNIHDNKNILSRAISKNFDKFARKCQSIYPTLVITTRDMNFIEYGNPGNENFVPMGTVFLSHGTIGQNHLVSYIYSAPEDQKLQKIEIPLRGIHPIVNNFCFSSKSLAKDEARKSISLFAQHSRQLAKTFDFIKGQTYSSTEFDNETISKQIVQAIKTTYDVTSSIGYDSSALEASVKSETSVEFAKTTSKTISSEYKRSLVADRDYKEEIYIFDFGQQSEVIRGFEKINSEDCPGSVWEHRHLDAGGILKIDSCFFDGLDIQFITNLRGVVFDTELDVINFRERLLEHYRGDINEQSKVDFLIARVAFFFDDDKRLSEKVALLAETFNVKANEIELVFPSILSKSLATQEYHITDNTYVLSTEKSLKEGLIKLPINQNTLE